MNSCSTIIYIRRYIMKEQLICDCEVIHEDIIYKVKKELLEDSTTFDIADFFKIFGDSTRIKILWALDKSEMCVCDLAFLLKMTKSAISHQLRILRDNKLVSIRKEGKFVYYHLNDEHVKDILEKALEHLEESK